MQRRRRINHGAGAVKVGVLRSGLGQKGGLVCMCMCVCVYVCMCVRRAQKIAKLYFSVRSAQFPFKLNMFFKNKYSNFLGPKYFVSFRKNRPPLNTSVSYFCRCSDHSKIIKVVEMYLIFFIVDFSYSFQGFQPGWIDTF